METAEKVALIGAAAGIVGAIVSGVFAILSSQAKGEATKTLQETRSLLRYEYHGATVAKTEYGGGKMVVVLDASNRDTPTSTPIDMDQFIKLCGDPDGCHLSMGATGIRPIDYSRTLEVPIMGPSCRFFYNGITKQWSVAESCVLVTAAYRSNKAKTSYEFSNYYQDYFYSNVFGTDDSDTEGHDVDGQPLIILSFKGACYLAESAPDTKRGGGLFLPDRADEPGTGKGLYLVTSDPSWEYQGRKLDTWDYKSPRRQCVLVVED